MLNVSKQDTMQPLLTEDQHLIQALSPDTPQKAFTDGIGSWRVIRCFENLAAACCCNTSETGLQLRGILQIEVANAVDTASIRNICPFEQAALFPLLTERVFSML